jgi:hypothetical protein
MFNQPSTRRVNHFVSAGIVLTLAGLFVASLASARILVNTIDPVAIAAGGGRISSSPGRLSALTERGLIYE